MMWPVVTWTSWITVWTKKQKSPQSCHARKLESNDNISRTNHIWQVSALHCLCLNHATQWSAQRGRCTKAAHGQHIRHNKKMILTSARNCAMLTSCPKMGSIWGLFMGLTQVSTNHSILWLWAVGNGDDVMCRWSLIKVKSMWPLDNTNDRTTCPTWSVLFLSWLTVFDMGTTLPATTSFSLAHRKDQSKDVGCTSLPNCFHFWLILWHVMSICQQLKRHVTFGAVQLHCIDNCINNEIKKGCHHTSTDMDWAQQQQNKQKALLRALRSSPHQDLIRTKSRWVKW